MTAWVIFKIAIPNNLLVNFNAAVSAQGNTDAAALANQNLLTVANLPEATPEKITSFEFGYKSILMNNTLVIDLDGYVNQYKGFPGPGSGVCSQRCTGVEPMQVSLPCLTETVILPRHPVVIQQAWDRAGTGYTPIPSATYYNWGIGTGHNL